MKNFLKASTLSFAFLLGGCESAIDHRGYTIDTIDFSKVQPGIHHKQDVQRLLGTPSATSNSGKDTWYYITNRTETKALEDPEIVSQQVVAIAFSEAGVVQSLQTTKGEEACTIKPAEEKTPTQGYETSILREIFSNFGRLGSEKPKDTL